MQTKMGNSCTKVSDLSNVLSYSSKLQQEMEKCRCGNGWWGWSAPCFCITSLSIGRLSYHRKIVGETNIRPKKKSIANAQAQALREKKKKVPVAVPVLSNSPPLLIESPRHAATSVRYGVLSRCAISADCRQLEGLLGRQGAKSCPLQVSDLRAKSCGDAKLPHALHDMFRRLRGAV